MSTTVKDAAKKIDLSQLKMNVETLIKCINSSSDYDIAIVPEETQPPWFEFSLECPAYNDNRMKFRRYISYLEVETIAMNIYENIKNYHNPEYELNFCVLLPRDESTQYSDPDKRDKTEKPTQDKKHVTLFKKIHLRMGFFE